MAQRKHRKHTPRTLVALVRDRSSSMMSRREATISGTREYVETLRRDAEGEVLVSLVEFNEKVEDRFIARPLDQLTEWDIRSYNPSGMTALLDAVGHTIVEIERWERPDDRVFVVILTDGMENASRRYRREEIRDMIRDNEKDGWEFVYLGAGRDAWTGGDLLGMRYDQSVYYGMDAHSHSSAIGMTAQANVAATRNARGTGAGIAFVNSSAIKSNLESTAGSRQTTPAPTATYRSYESNTSQGSHRGGNSPDSLRKRANQQKRDTNGRFVRQ